MFSAIPIPRRKRVRRYTGNIKRPVVLVVEDDHDARRMMARRLEREIGVEVVEVGNGAS